MGQRVPSFFGNIPKRDHICWPTMPPTQAQAVLDACVAGNGLPGEYGTAQRPSCTLAQIMAVVWRIKEWRFTGEIRLDTPSGGGYKAVIEDSPTPNEMRLQTLWPSGLTLSDITDERLIASEFPSTPNGVGGQYSDDFGFPLRNAGFVSPLTSGFLTRRLRLKYTNLAVNFDFTNTNAPIFFFMNVRGLDIVKWDNTDPDNPIFQPFFYFHTNALAGMFIRTPIISETATANRYFTIDPLIAPPILAPLIYTSDFGIASTASNIKATAHKFYPYANSAGDPVYDVDTGAQLVDPFS